MFFRIIKNPYSGAIDIWASHYCDMMDAPPKALYHDEVDCYNAEIIGFISTTDKDKVEAICFRLTNDIDDEITDTLVGSRNTDPAQ